MKSLQFISICCRWWRAWSALCALALMLLVGGTLVAQEAAVPKRFPDAKASDCAACHGKRSPLPQDHPEVAGMELKACRECHAAGSPQTLVGKLPLAHIHQLSGVGCAGCHGDVKSPEAVPAKDCLKCHDMEKVATQTAGAKPSNPHDSPHYGKNSDCNLCHHQHEKSENYCSQCHNFRFVVP